MNEVQDVKIEPGRERAKRRRLDKVAKKKAAQQKEDAERAKRDAELKSRRTSHHCSHCDRGFIRDFYRVAHERCCLGLQRSSVHKQKMAAVKKFQFNIFKGHEYVMLSNSEGGL